MSGVEITDSRAAQEEIDKAVAAVQWHSFSALEALQGAFEGATHKKRSMRNWSADPGSADATTVWDLPTLRARSRDLVRNSGMATSAIEKQVLYTTGDSLRCNPMPDADMLRAFGLELTDEQVQDWAKVARAIWQYHEAHLDVERKHHGAELDDVVLRGVLESGDCLVIRRFLERPESRYGTRLQVIEADRLSTPRTYGGGILSPYALDPSLAPVVDGVERDLSTGEAVAYHVASSHPGDSMYYYGGRTTWTRIAAWDEVLGQRLALHPMLPKRPGQTRGVPLLAPVIEEIKQIHQFTDAELAAAVVASYFTVFIKSVSATGLANRAQEAGTSTQESKTLADEVALGPAATVALGQNEEIEVADPKRPNPDSNDFVMGMARMIGSATGTPAEVLMSAFTSSYSASRAALLEMWRGVRARRGWYYRAFKTPTYEWTITEAVARGDLIAPGFFADPRIRAAWLRVGWIGDPPGQIDPNREMAAVEKRINLGIGTKTQATIETTGGDFDADARRRAQEKALEDELGLTSEPPVAEPPVPEPPGPTNGEED